MDTSQSLDRRVQRLHHELDDEGISVPGDDRLRRLLLVELDYARHPHAHEGTPARYGALVSVAGVGAQNGPTPFTIVEAGAIPLHVVRMLADGRSTFLARQVGEPDRLICFDRTREYESSAVHLTVATDALVLQRLGHGWVRLSSPDGVATWDGMHWSVKPLSLELAQRIGAVVRDGDRRVLSLLLEFCVHWLGAARVGASFIWRLDGDPHGLEHLGLDAAVTIPRLSIRRRAHFAALLSTLSQFDRAALVDARGKIETVGAQMRSTEHSRRAVAPFRGTRHTASLRYSYDVPEAVVFVVSSNGELTVCWRGQRLDVSNRPPKP